MRGKAGAGERVVQVKRRGGPGWSRPFLLILSAPPYCPKGAPLPTWRVAGAVAPLSMNVPTQTV